MPRNKQIPINRSNKFFSGDDFDLEIDFGREWLEGDINIKVILFQVDRQNSLTDSLYGEAEKDGITFKYQLILKWMNLLIRLTIVMVV